MVSLTSSNACPSPMAGPVQAAVNPSSRVRAARAIRNGDLRVELPDVADGELPQERAQRRGCIASSSMLSAPATIPATSEATVNPRDRALVGGHREWSSVNFRSPAHPAKASTGTRPAADTRLGSSKAAGVTRSV